MNPAHTVILYKSFPMLLSCYLSSISKSSLYHTWGRLLSIARLSGGRETLCSCVWWVFESHFSSATMKFTITLAEPGFSLPHTAVTTMFTFRGTWNTGLSLRVCDYLNHSLTLPWLKHMYPYRHFFSQYIFSYLRTYVINALWSYFLLQ